MQFKFLCNFSPFLNFFRKIFIFIFFAPSSGHCTSIPPNHHHSILHNIYPCLIYGKDYDIFFSGLVKKSSALYMCWLSTLQIWSFLRLPTRSRHLLPGMRIRIRYFFNLLQCMYKIIFILNKIKTRINKFKHKMMVYNIEFYAHLPKI